MITISTQAQIEKPANRYASANVMCSYQWYDSTTA